MKAKVTLTIDRALWLQFRAEAIKRGVSASALIEKFISAQLKRAKEQQ